MTGLKGFIVAYHRLDKNDQVKKYRVGPTVRGFRIQTVAQDTLYLVCVITRGSSYSEDGSMNQLTYQTVNTGTDVYADTFDPEGEDDDDELSDDEDKEDDLNQFYVMPLGDWSTGEEDEELKRKKRRKRRRRRDVDSSIDFFTLDEEQLSKLDKPEESSASFSDRFLFPPWGNDDPDTLNETDIFIFPSSNDTELLVNKPAIVNLGSQSSKCIQIRTPADPAKLSLIDDKKMSAVIGVSMGLLVFIGIIISILTASNKDKEKEEANENSSVNGSAKSPKSSLRNSRTNSLESSGLANRLIEASAETALLTAAKPKVNSVENTPRKRESEKTSNILRRTAKQKLSKGESKENKKRSFSKQSSTEESRQSSSECTASRGRHSRHNSDGGFGESIIHLTKGRHAPPMGPPPGGQSWHGTPRGDPRSRTVSGGPFESMRNNCDGNYSTTFPRRAMGEMSGSSTLGRIHPLAASGMSLDREPNTLGKRRSDPVHMQDGSTTSIPLIEYHLIDGNPPRPPPARQTSFNRPPPPLPSVSPWSSGQPPPPLPKPRGPPPQPINAVASPPIMRCNTFDQHISGSSQRLLGNHISNGGANAASDLDCIEYYPEVNTTGRPGPVSMRPVTPGTGGTSPRHQPHPRPFVKYNSFANY